MSAIFKHRRVPRHLIIHDEYDGRPKSRLRPGRMMVWLLLAAAAFFAAYNGLSLP